MFVLHKLSSVQKRCAETKITTVELRYRPQDKEQKNSTPATEEFTAQLRWFNMSNAEDTNASEEEQHLDKDIVKETNKPKYFLEETDEFIKVQDYTEIELMGKRQAEMIIIGSCSTNRSWKLIEV